MAKPNLKAVVNQKTIQNTEMIFSGLYSLVDEFEEKEEKISALLLAAQSYIVGDDKDNKCIENSLFEAILDITFDINIRGHFKKYLKQMEVILAANGLIREDNANG